MCDVRSSYPVAPWFRQARCLRNDALLTATRLAELTGILADGIQSLASTTERPYARQITSRLTQDVCIWLLRMGLDPIDEFRLGKLPSGRGMRVDVCGVMGTHIKVAIEIDRGNKQASVNKLLHAVHVCGAEALWVRWGTPHRLPSALGRTLPLEINIVELPIEYRRYQRGG